MDESVRDKKKQSARGYFESEVLSVTRCFRLKGDR